MGATQELTETALGLDGLDSGASPRAHSLRRRKGGREKCRRHRSNEGQVSGLGRIRRGDTDLFGGAFTIRTGYERVKPFKNVTRGKHVAPSKM